MTNPTSNYSFQMPTASDLVTDLPADFEVFGQAVDTRLKALNPATTLGDITYASSTANTNTRLPIGTNGQVLGVSGGVPAWVTDATGMTNPMTTTGDTIYSSSGSTPARLGIGTTGQVLTVSAGVPAWATPTSGSMTQLATGTLSGASVSITSISGAYQDLLLVITKFRPATDGANLWLRMNNVTAANYASSTSGAGGSSGTAGANQVTLTNQQDDTANSYSLMVFRFPQYANAITWKYLVGESVTNNSGDPLDINFSRPIGILSQTTAAITQIDLLSSSGNLTSGTYTLYGVI